MGEAQLRDIESERVDIWTKSYKCRPSTPSEARISIRTPPHPGLPDTSSTYLPDNTPSFIPRTHGES